MKKQDIFLLTYIVFIFVCVIVHCVTDYQMWNSVVSAVSFSSMFLAYADAIFPVAQTYQEMFNTGLDKVYYMNKRINVEEEAIFEMTKKVDSIPKEKFNTCEIKQELEQLKITHKKAREEVDVFKVENTKWNTRKKVANGFANSAYFLGFFSFLCILVFYPITDKTNNLQTVVSVLAFAIVLSAQMFSSISSRVMQKRKKNTERKVEHCNKCIEEIEDIKQKVNAFVEAVNN